MQIHRGGWNNAETELTAGNLGTLHLSRPFLVDEKVEGQPLVFGDALSVFTMNNSVYRFDMHMGAQFGVRPLGAAVNPRSLPGQMDDKGTYKRWGIASAR